MWGSETTVNDSKTQHERLRLTKLRAALSKILIFNFREEIEFADNFPSTSLGKQVTNMKCDGANVTFLKFSDLNFSYPGQCLKPINEILQTFSSGEYRSFKAP